MNPDSPPLEEADMHLYSEYKPENLAKAMKAERALKGNRSLEYEREYRQHLMNASQCKEITFKKDKDVTNFYYLIEGNPGWIGTIKVDLKLKDENPSLCQWLHGQARNFSMKHQTVTYDDQGYNTMTKDGKDE